jgi:hypothetical protein
VTRATYATRRNDAGSDSVEPNAVLQWLEHSGVLQQPPLPLPFLEDALGPALSSRQRPLLGGQFHGDSSGDEREECSGGSGRYDCGREGCSKPFAHQHVDASAGARGGACDTAPRQLMAPGVGRLS